MRQFGVLIFCAFFLQNGCDEQGLNPNDVVEPGFGGTISFISKIPPIDSLRDLRIVAVPYYPIDTLFQPLILKVIDGVIPFSEDIRVKADSGKTSQFEMYVKPQAYYYVAIVQQYGMDVFSQWKVVSVYGHTSLNPNPVAISISDGKFTKDIHFTVDFYNLPPQPFKTP